LNCVSKPRFHAKEVFIEGVWSEGEKVGEKDI